jgi:putative flippase GtrA
MLNKKHNSLLNIRHFFLYFIFGILSMLLGLLFLLFFYQIARFNFTISYILSAHVGVFSSFTLNNLYTFSTNDFLIRRFFSFYIVALLGILIGYVSAIIIINIFTLDYIYASLISYFIVYIFQYILNKLLTFRK